MELANSTELCKKYSELSDEALSDLYKSGNLSDIAIDCARAELISRGIEILSVDPDNPKAENISDSSSSKHSEAIHDYENDDVDPRVVLQEIAGDLSFLRWEFGDFKEKFENNNFYLKELIAQKIKDLVSIGWAICMLLLFHVLHHW